MLEEPTKQTHTSSYEIVLINRFFHLNDRYIKESYFIIVYLHQTVNICASLMISMQHITSDGVAIAETPSHTMPCHRIHTTTYYALSSYTHHHISCHGYCIHTITYYGVVIDDRHHITSSDSVAWLLHHITSFKINAKDSKGNANTIS